MPRKVKISSASVKTSVPTDVGIKAAEAAAKVAADNGIVCALAGGIAMHIYGFTRATTDVDLLASEKLPLESKRKLSFGGESYRVKVGKHEIQVDAIVRDDEYAAVYRSALDDALETDTKVKIVSPEWMVILKYFSARAKDKLDLLWLLQQDGLVERKQVLKNLRKGMGKEAAFFVEKELKAEFDYADFLKVRERSK